MIYVLDACAMIAYLRGEEGGSEVDKLLVQPGARCVAHSVNLCEVYYDLIRQGGVRVAEEAIADLTRAQQQALAALVAEVSRLVAADSARAEG